MRTAVVTVAVLGSSNPVIVSDYAYFNVGFAVVLSAGASMTYKVQHTYDNIGDGTNGTITVANATWFDHPTVTGQTITKDGSYTSPIQALRVTTTVYASGTATLSVMSSAR